MAIDKSITRESTVIFNASLLPLSLRKVRQIYMSNKIKQLVSALNYKRVLGCDMPDKLSCSDSF